MTTVTTTAPLPGVKELERSARKSTRTAFRALFLRDITVLRKSLKEFLPRTLLQPFLLVFIFTYVFPKIGQGVGGTEAAAGFSTLLVAGVVGIAERHGFDVSDLSITEPTLETVFINLTGKDLRE